MTQQTKYRLLYFIFVISGFSGLIYESIWSHYLKLFLGHAAFAQVLVLSIFMGGMALGAWLAGKLLPRNMNLLYAYALVEMLIGLFGISFHGVFQWAMDQSFNVIIPYLENPGLVQFYKWSLGGILILPQSILLGTTFPLMVNGLLRMHDSLPGRSISLLYFGNSIGAAIGVLVSGFYLIAKVGIPGTILTAGIINIVIAIAVYQIAKSQSVNKSLKIPSVNGAGKIPVLILLAAFITGSASFIYELVWVRMLSMVLGASTHAFELMLSAFITGLAFGGLWIHNRIDKIANPVQFAAFIQIFMALIALSTLTLYDYTFELMSFLISALDINEGSYLLFNLGSHFIALIVMLPTTFLAGMTLPLFTSILLNNGYGERSVSHVYVSNMLGAIIGIIFTILIGMPLLGIKGSMIAGSSLDLLLGIGLLLYLGPGFRPIIITTVLVFFIMSFSSQLDPHRMSSAVFRYGYTDRSQNSDIIFHKDGMTATVTVVKYHSGTQSIYTNGKPDASVFVGGSDEVVTTNDEITQVMLAAVPLAIHPDAKKVANIGIGSGMSSHTVMLWPGIEQLDTIEIEPAMIEGAQHFRPKSELVFTDPRSIIHLEDARTFFSFSKDKYDFIISEPSNPWVSGVSSLYTREFYERIKSALKDDGYLVQWLHIYEIDKMLFFSVLKALSEHFDDFRVYATNSNDVVIIARPQGKVGVIKPDIFSVDPMREALAKLGIHNLVDFDVRYLADRQFLRPLLNNISIQSNSDYFPLLDLYAPKARFMRDSVTFLNDLKNSPIAVTRLLLETHRTENTDVGVFDSYEYSRYARQAQAIHHQLTGSDAGIVGQHISNPVIIEYMLNSARYCLVNQQGALWVRQFLELIKATIPYLNQHEMNSLVNSIQPACTDGLTDFQKQWLDLISAVNDLNHNQVIDISRLLLQQDSISLIQEEYQFLVALQSLSLYMQNRDDEFIQLLNQYSNRLSEGETLPIEVELLFQHVLERKQSIN